MEHTVLAKFDTTSKIKSLRGIKLPKFVISALEQILDKSFKDDTDLFKNLQEHSTISISDTHKKKIKTIITYSGDYDKLIIKSDHVSKKILQHYGGRYLKVEIDEYRKHRSDKQNRYLHGVIIPVIIAFEKNRGADWLKNKTNKQAIDICKAYIYKNILGYGINFQIVHSVEVFTMEGKYFSQMKTDEFYHAAEAVRDFYNEIGCNIPKPTKDCFIADYLNKNKND